VEPGAGRVDPSPDDVQTRLCLNNWRHHREDLVLGRAFEAAVDPYSSGVAFTGWKGRRFRVPEGYLPLPVSPPATALLRWQWTRFGQIDAFECPGPPRF
jgi:hypothetical protein